MSELIAEIPGGKPAIFLERPNRFILRALLESGDEALVHVPDPGRLLELLYTGNRILILPACTTGRKTAWSLLGAWTSGGWILVNTSFHRKLATGIFTSDISPFGKASSLRAEVISPLGGSRFDFLIDGELWIEVKGCTLRKNGMAMFPDAPTSRGRKHVLELKKMSLMGMRTGVVFLVFVRDVSCFAANRETDPEFADALLEAVDAGVTVSCLQLSFDGARVKYRGTLDLTRNPAV